MDVLPGTLDQLAARLEMLERRVAALENPSAAPVETATLAKPQIEAGEELSFAQTGSVFPVLGKAMLGIAGAYMLRAVAESTTLPRLAIAAVAIVYALVWLIVAARVSLEKWISSAIYAGTSSLILAPMLWELTLSFKVMTPPMTAGVLCVFVIVANSLAWKQNRTPICWVANVTAAVVALALPVATHELTPFLAALLLMALLGEYAAGRKRLMSLRPFVALASDAAIWSLIFIYSSPASTRMDYPAMSMAALILPGCILFLIFGASIVFRCARIGATISVFEIAQAMVAFLLAAWSTVAFAPGRGTIVLGIACLLLSMVSYAAAFLLFDKYKERRNFHVFGLWAAGLFLAGCLLCLPAFWAMAWLGLAAVAAMIFGTRLKRQTLGMHGLVFLISAAIVSGMLEFDLNALAGELPSALAAGVLAVSLCSLACYAAEDFRAQANWPRQLLQTATAALAECALAALLVKGLLGVVALRIALGAQHVAFIRTLVLCAAALLLAYTGSIWRRRELTHLAYGTVGLVALKLLIEDLRLGHLVFIAASIFLFAIALMAVPRLARVKQLN